MDNQLLRVEDVALILRVSRSFAYLLTRSGRLPAVRLGRSVRVRAEDLERFVSENLPATSQMDDGDNLGSEMLTVIPKDTADE